MEPTVQCSRDVLTHFPSASVLCTTQLYCYYKKSVANPGYQIDDPTEFYLHYHIMINANAASGKLLQKLNREAECKSSPSYTRLLPNQTLIYHNSYMRMQGFPKEPMISTVCSSLSSIKLLP